MAWTVFTTVFVWLPIVRALARPDGYQWGFFGLRGEGLSGWFVVFPLLAAYAITMFAHSWIRWRGLFRCMLVAWHLGWATMLTAAAIAVGNESRWQGQGWGFNFPIPPIALVFSIMALAVLYWAYRDWRLRIAVRSSTAQWSKKNSRRLVVASVLFPVAICLFRFGDDYNWMTALAIAVTIIQWITLSYALEADDLEFVHDPGPDEPTWSAD